MHTSQTRALYIAYLSGVAGQSIGVFFIGEGMVAGVDAGGMIYKGSYTIGSDGKLNIIASFTIPGGEQLITGLAADKQVTIPIQASLDPNFADGRIISVTTMAGVVNARFEKLQDLGVR